LGPFLNLIQIVVSIALIILILLQTKSTGQHLRCSDTIYTAAVASTNAVSFTIGLALFFLIAIINVIVSS
jgi:preprotein translocase subunit SecG